MSTQIKFTGSEDNWVRAHEDIDEVLSRWQDSNGNPFEVITGSNRRTFINPSHIACIREPVTETKVP